eukprot:2251333-Pleurochrysis_carterae.AAC.1
MVSTLIRRLYNLKSRELSAVHAVVTQGLSVSCGGARGAGGGSVSVAAGRPGGCAASAFPG